MKDRESPANRKRVGTTSEETVDQEKKTLVESEQHYRALVEHAPDAIVVLDTDSGRFVDCNPNTLRLFGLTREELLSVGPLEVSPPVQSDGRLSTDVSRDNRARVMDGHQLTFPWLHKHTDGHVIPCEVHLLRLPGKGRVLLRGSITNIEERMKAERTLRESEEKYRVVADAATDAIITINEDSEILYANPSTETVFGYPPRELVGRHLTLLMPEPARTRHTESLRRFVASGKRNVPWNGLEIPALHRSGRIFPVEISFGSMRRENGEYLFIGIVRDISERKRIESLQSGRGACGMTVIEGARMIVTDLEDLAQPTDQIKLALRLGLRTCWSQPIISHNEQILGSFVVFFGQPHHPSNQDLELLKQAACIAGMAVERTRAHEALQRSEAALRKSHLELQGLAGKLISAHEEERRKVARELHDDITQRLASLAIELGKLEQDRVSGSSSLEGRIGDPQKRMVKLADDIQGVSRQLHPSILDDLGLVDAIESECSRFSEREGIRTRFLPESIPEELLKNVSLCLYRVTQEGLRNIAKHSRAREVNVSLSAEARCIQLQIRDSGIGFVPSRVRGRGGLGLASMEERVRLIEGDISVHSRPEKGTTIKVRAPLPGRKQKPTF